MYKRTVVVKLRPTRAQERLFRKTLGAIRFVWNELLEWILEQKKETGRYPLRGVASARLTAMKRVHPFLCEVNAQALQAVVSDLYETLGKRFSHGFGLPNFKAKSKTKRTFRVPNSNRVEKPPLRFDDGCLVIVKYHHVKAVGRNTELLIDTYIRNVTVKHTAFGWYAYCLVEYEGEEVQPIDLPNATAGIDIGSVNPLTVCTLPDDEAEPESFAIYGKQFKVNLLYWEKKRAHYQRKLERCVPESAGWLRTRDKIRECAQKETNIRKDFAEKTSRTLADNHSVIRAEDLNLEKLTRSNAGTKENPGSCVAQKRAMNNALRRLGHSATLHRTEQKVRENGGQFFYVPAHYTSQRCSACGYTDKKNRVSRDKFKCKACGFTDGADHNASFNIAVRNTWVKE